MNPPSLFLRILAVVAIAFGVLTLLSGGAVLFGGEQTRDAAGAYVPFVIWFNFLSGFAYVAAGAGLYAGRRWAGMLAAALALALVAVSVAFALHVAGGGAFEMRTVAALGLRTLLWLVIAAFACSQLGCLRTQAAG